jgi:hypothetical protein
MKNNSFWFLNLASKKLQCDNQSLQLLKNMSRAPKSREEFLEAKSIFEKWDIDTSC